eukprot:XP_014071436.1 PREDICTED: leucine-rich repeat extensin-like protein 3 [Salmo salar]
MVGRCVKCHTESYLLGPLALFKKYSHMNMLLKLEKWGNPREIEGDQTAHFEHLSNLRLQEERSHQSTPSLSIHSHQPHSLPFPSTHISPTPSLFHPLTSVHSLPFPSTHISPLPPFSIHSHQPTPCLFIHSHQPTPSLFIHSHQPTPSLFIHSHRPTPSLFIHSHRPTPSLFIHSHRPTPSLFIHSHRPTPSLFHPLTSPHSLPFHPLTSPHSVPFPSTHIGPTPSLSIHSHRPHSLPFPSTHIAPLPAFSSTHIGPLPPFSSTHISPTPCLFHPLTSVRFLVPSSLNVDICYDQWWGRYKKRLYITYILPNTYRPIMTDTSISCTTFPATSLFTSPWGTACSPD